MRTIEHNKKISQSLREHYINETEEQREIRLKSINEKKEIRREFYKKLNEFKNLLELMDEMNMKI